jgi:hypothetical protein
MWLSNPLLNMLEVKPFNISYNVCLHCSPTYKKDISIVAPLSLSFTANTAHILLAELKCVQSGFSYTKQGVISFKLCE